MQPTPTRKGSLTAPAWAAASLSRAQARRSQSGSFDGSVFVASVLDGASEGPSTAQPTRTPEGSLTAPAWASASLSHAQARRSHSSSLDGGVFVAGGLDAGSLGGGLDAGFDSTSGLGVTENASDNQADSSAGPDWLPTALCPIPRGRRPRHSR